MGDYPYGGLFAGEEPVKKRSNDDVPPLRPIEGNGGPTSLESEETRTLVRDAGAVEEMLRMGRSR